MPNFTMRAVLISTCVRGRRGSGLSRRKKRPTRVWIVTQTHGLWSFSMQLFRGFTFFVQPNLVAARFDSQSLSARPVPNRNAETDVRSRVREVPAERLAGLSSWGAPSPCSPAPRRPRPRRQKSRVPLLLLRAAAACDPKPKPKHSTAHARRNQTVPALAAASESRDVRCRTSELRVSEPTPKSVRKAPKANPQTKNLE